MKKYFYLILSFIALGFSQESFSQSIEAGEYHTLLVCSSGTPKGAGKNWDGQAFAKIKKAYGTDERTEGTVLVQMLEDRKIKFEVFPSKITSQVSVFTENAKFYTR